MRDDFYQQDPGSGICFIERGQGPPVLLLHGNGADAALYLPLIEAMSPHYRVLVPDLPGFGRSPAREKRTMAGYLGELERFVNRRIREPFAMMGHSMGGFIAYQLMLRRRIQPIERAILMEAALFNIDPRVAALLPLYGFIARFKPHNREKIEARLRDWCLDWDGMPADFRENFIQSFFRSDSQVQGMFMASAPSLLPYRFSEITQPVLCLRGQKQQFLSRQTDFYAPKLPNGRRVVIPDAGHFLLFENDPAVYQEIFAFLAPLGQAVVRKA